VARGARIAGFRPEQLRLVATDEEFRLRADALEAAVREDAAAGRRPFCIVANAGATNTGAIDPLPELAAIARREGLWLHVDAAYGGFAVLTERGRAWLRGIGEADSLTLDPHKWLHQPFEAGCVLVREGRLLGETFHVMPDYLQDTAVGGEEVNFADRGIQLTRMARALKIWLSLKFFGTDAFRAAIDDAIDLTLHAQQCVEAHPELELLAPARLGVLCFRRRPAGVEEEGVLEARNAALLRRVLRSGEAMLSSTRLHGRYSLRICILNHRTRRTDVDRVLGAIADAPLDA
jgi:glutamate/tyrosine decarboxylase-like PLP-dependent enzyme